MKLLVVEDDFASRKILTKYLEDIGNVDAAVDGLEAVQAFKKALDADELYDVVFLDIMLPGMNGQNVLNNIRDMEGEKGIAGSDRVKVIMTTALGDAANILQAFRSQCEAYLTKPITKEALLKELKDLEIIP